MSRRYGAQLPDSEAIAQPTRSTGILELKARPSAAESRRNWHVT
jgi:hypothetical protein